MDDNGVTGEELLTELIEDPTNEELRRAIRDRVIQINSRVVEFEVEEQEE